MYKSILTFLLGAALTATAAAEVEQLSPTHAIERVEVEHRYMLLPIEESQPVSHVSVIIDGRTVQTVNVRLARTHTDYVVPLDIQAFGRRQLLLDYDLAAEGSVVAARQSDTFDCANREPLRPAYHHTPAWGWMNDPNGMFYNDGVYHLYYQHNPYGSQWENLSWGHSTSTDLVHWTAQPEALVPDALGMIFSGSCVVAGDSIVALYTSAAKAQTQSMAVSHDGGQTFKPYAGNPILTAPIPDFRDPRPFWCDATQEWNLVMACGQEMRFYSSTDLKTWRYESAFGHGAGTHSGVWECPDMLRFGDKWLLICNINPGGPSGGSATQYFVGTWDGHQFVSSQKDTRWMDYGKDHYATVSFHNAPDGRAIVVPWMSNWQYADRVPTRQYRSANGLPRDLSLYTYEGETYCASTPSPELLAIRGAEVKAPTPECEIVAGVKPGAIITLANDKGEKVVMRMGANTFTMDRTESGNVGFAHEFPCVTEAPLRGATRELRIFVDHSSVEAFTADGRMAMTNLVFPSQPYDQLTVEGGKAKIYEIKL